jgi:AcrR family transcriptional regulator
MHETRQNQRHTATRDEIKHAARIAMARHGAAALSLRAVARDLQLSAAALYYYYPNRDALITDLILDAYNALAAALRAVSSDPAASAFRQLLALLHAYRSWAVAHAAEYDLILGTPIAGYHAPMEQTGPAARQVLGVVVDTLERLAVAGQIRLYSTQAQGPDGAPTDQWSALREQPASPPSVHTAVRLWSMAHGLISLELAGHLHHIVGNPEDFFGAEMAAMLTPLLAEERT